MLSFVNGKLLPFHEKRNGGSSMWRKNCIFVVRCPLKVSCIRHPLCRVKGLILLLISMARRPTEGSQLLPRAAPCRSPWRSAEAREPCCSISCVGLRLVHVSMAGLRGRGCSHERSASLCAMRRKSRRRNGGTVTGVEETGRCLGVI
jgi:hypothetical protein